MTYKQVCGTMLYHGGRNNGKDNNQFGGQETLDG